MFHVLTKTRVLKTQVWLAGSQVWPQGADVRYAAPEVVHALQQNMQIAAKPEHDLWALGVLAYETITGRRIFTNNDPDTAFRCANALLAYPWGNDQQDPAFANDAARSAVEGCLRRDPMARDTAVTVANKMSRIGGFSTAPKFGPWHVNQDGEGHYGQPQEE